MRNPVPLSPENFDWFCRAALARLGTYRYVVDCGDKTSAAEILPVGAQGVGQIMAKLEQALADWMDGGNLANPTYKRTVPTEAGRLIYAFATDVMSRSDQFLTDLIKLQSSHEVKVATIDSAWNAHHKKLQAELRKRVPNSTIVRTIFTGSKYPEKIENEVREWRADIGITSFPGKVEPPLVLEMLKPQELRLVLASTYRKLPKGPIVNLSEMLRNDYDLKVVTHPRGLDGPLSKVVMAYLRKLDADWGPGQKIEASKIAEIKAMVESTPRTMALLPRDSVAAEVRAGKLVSYRLDPIPPAFTWGIIYRPGSSRRAVRELINCFDIYK